ncbi:MAG: helix-turn-helix domain-containing protein [Oscillospiraceae bacterium]|nr:helix-turn-helix domain-containing protein [Oscillospiraceae bacterium]
MAMTNRASFRMFTINEAAAFFGLPKHYIRQLVLTKQIPSLTAGKKYLINEKLLESYLLNGAACATMEAQETKPLSKGER